MLCGTAQAQSAFTWPAPEVQSAGEAKRYYLPMGTPLVVRTRTQISTKDNKAGDRLSLEVAESVSCRGQTVIPIGAPVLAEVSRVQRNGHFGKKGKLEIRLIGAETPHGPVRLGAAPGPSRPGVRNFIRIGANFFAPEELWVPPAGESLTRARRTCADFAGIRGNCAKRRSKKQSDMIFMSHIDHV